MILSEADNQRERTKLIDKWLADPDIKPRTRAGMEQSRRDALAIIADLEGRD